MELNGLKYDYVERKRSVVIKVDAVSIDFDNKVSLRSIRTL